MTTHSPDPGLDAVGMLQEPLRRQLYRYVVTQRREVSRHEAATALGVQRTLAAFHLDKLVDAGLLEASFRRLTERTGPGAGRPAKLYRRAATDHSVNLPPRSYPVAAELLAETVDEVGADATLNAAARRAGRTLGQRAAGQPGALIASNGSRPSPPSPSGPQPKPTHPRPGSPRDHPAAPPNRSSPSAPPNPPTSPTEAGALARHWEVTRHFEAVLAENGFEPFWDGSQLRLHNCPFRLLARQFPPLICGMNLALLEGIVEGFGEPELRVQMDPAPGRCCVTIQLAEAADSKTETD